MGENPFSDEHPMLGFKRTIKEGSKIHLKKASKGLTPQKGKKMILNPQKQENDTKPD